ncbi:MAG: PAS domain-containing protein, partial [Spirochaetes bacterium]|nr:PAS domain-containing protein [Spirochaetota bacterium]
VLMAAVVWWTLFAALEAAAVDTTLKILISKIEYVGTVCTAPLFLLFALLSRAGERRPKAPRLGTLWIVPLATLAAVFTNDWHRLFWTGFTPSPVAGSNLLVYGHGPLFYVQTAYAFALTLAGTILLARSAFGAQRVFRLQAAVLLAAAVAPWVGVVVYLTPLNPWPGLDLIPLSFTATGVLLLLALWRFRLLDLAPVALRQLFAGMTDGFVVLDAQDRVVDINPAARQLFGAEDNPVGLPARSLAGWDRMIPARWGTGEERIETRFPGEPARYLDLRVTTIAGSEGGVAGRLVVIRDVTARREVELERERLIGELQRALADIRTLRGLLPICAGCKKIRDDQGYWKGLEQYLSEHAEVQFSHGLCPDCLSKYYPASAEDEGPADGGALRDAEGPGSRR